MTLKTHDDVAVVTLDNPPVNALSAVVRTALARQIEIANRSDTVNAIVMTGASRTFSGGADISKQAATVPIATAAVIGCGTMGGGIAMSMANAGVPVAALEDSHDALDRGSTSFGGTTRRRYRKDDSRRPSWMSGWR